MLTFVFRLIVVSCIVLSCVLALFCLSVLNIFNVFLDFVYSFLDFFAYPVGFISEKSIKIFSLCCVLSETITIMNELNSLVLPAF